MVYIADRDYLPLSIKATGGILDSHRYRVVARLGSGWRPLYKPAGRVNGHARWRLLQRICQGIAQVRVGRLHVVSVVGCIRSLNDGYRGDLGRVVYRVDRDSDSGYWGLVAAVATVAVTDAAAPVILVAIVIVGAEVQLVSEMIQEMPSEYRRRLLTKYAVIEWLSMDEHFRRLFNEVSHGKTGFRLSDGQSKSLRTKRNTHFQASREFQRAFKVIRNQIGAHRESIHFKLVAEYWDTLDVELLSKFCESSAEAFNFLKDLPVYRWTKSGKDEQGREITAFISPLKITEPGERN